MLDKKKVVIGYSGGVDSTVSAYLLKKQGFHVTAVMLKTYKEDDTHFLEEEENARRQIEELGIDYVLLDISKEFKDRIVDLFIDEYTNGRTPNPCIYCNYMIKWRYLIEYANKISAYYVATGHYANVIALDNGRYSIKNSKSSKKDQTYVLYHLDQETLSRIIFPLSEYEKEKTRAIAKELGLSVADKPDSQEICFVEDDDYVGFIERNKDVSKLKGNFVDEHGNVLGEHKGIHRYTIGQRRGLGLPLGERAFVKEICPNTNEVVISSEESLYKKEFYLTNVNLMSIPSLDDEMRVLARVRYHHKGSMSTISMMKDGRIRCILDDAQRAITLGQAAIFYKDNYIVAGGIIDEIV